LTDDQDTKTQKLTAVLYRRPVWVEVCCLGLGGVKNQILRGPEIVDLSL